ncbi:arsenosugar biosynthesis-associated peroxidase-like protein [Tundrisphaera sp. TA3]|uniref:arsenosugar biosynthesis-associated peroxidase-like protein n=1 Tax=Tundrisphaera sp. TA3 TaxID=3435775 RepID=UPI003EBFCD5E
MSTFYKTEDLARLPEVASGAPALWEKFQGWYSEVFRDGELTAREKALIGLAVSNALQCPYCIDVTTRSSLEQGCSVPQMTEAIQVAAAIRAGATLSHGIQMREVADQRTG